MFPVISKHGTGSGWELRSAPDCISFVITRAPYRGHDAVMAGIDFGKLDNNYYHLAGTFDGVEAKIYFNHELLSTLKVPHSVKEMAHFNQRPIRLGGSSGWGDRHSFTGIIKEARVCNSTLQPDQFLPIPAE